MAFTLFQREPSSGSQGWAGRSVELEPEPWHHGALVAGALRDEAGVVPAVQVLLEHVVWRTVEFCALRRRIASGLRLRVPVTTVGGPPPGPMIASLSALPAPGPRERTSVSTPASATSTMAISPSAGCPRSSLRASSSGCSRVRRPRHCRPGRGNRGLRGPAAHRHGALPRRGEKALAIDPFTWPDPGVRGRFEANCGAYGVPAGRLAVLQGDSRLMTPQQLIAASAAAPSASSTSTASTRLSTWPATCALPPPSRRRTGLSPWMTCCTRATRSSR